MTTEFGAALTTTEEAADAWETAAIALAGLEEDLLQAKDGLALVEAEVRLSEPLTGSNAEDRAAQLTVRLHSSDEWRGAWLDLASKRALVETARALVERARMHRQERLWVMRYHAGMSSGPVDEL